MARKAMDSIYDLIEEAKLRTAWWALFIFAVSYFLTHTSKSMWMNIPMSILFVCGLRYLFNEVEFRWKVRMSCPRTYLSHLERKQLSLNDPRLSTTPDPPRWKRKIDSPVVEAAISDFVDKIVKDFVIDLWLSEITPDMETAEHIRSIILDAIAEVAGRATQLNLVNLLTKDVVDLIGDHLELFRRNQAVIGVDVMKTLSSEERDERLKHHLMASNELHPALLSSESEHKVLQRLMGGVVATVLRPQEAQIPIARSIAREILTCLVMQPLMNLASPGYINELIETLLLTSDEESSGLGNVAARYGPSAASNTGENSSSKGHLSLGQGSELPLVNIKHTGTSPYQVTPSVESLKTKPADWALMLDVAKKRRTEVLMPENLENLWAKGRNYKKKERKYLQARLPNPSVKGSSLDSSLPEGNLGEGMSTNLSQKIEVKAGSLPFMPGQESTFGGLLSDGNANRSQWTQESDMGLFLEGEPSAGELDGAKNGAHYKNRLKRSNSTSDLSIPSHKVEMPIISNFYSPEFEKYREKFGGKSNSDVAVRKEVQQVPKLRCRVMGAYFEKLGSKSFAVYSIAVTAAENRTWFVKRRYSNFERLHRHLKDIPNYTLHLPPKRIFSSSTEDAFVHQRCIQLDKYLQDLLSIANVAEQHEVWDFLSVSSKNYSFGKSSSVMRTLAVNVDDAVDDIVRQFRGVSDVLMCKVSGTTSPGSEGSIYPSTSVYGAEEEKSISGPLNLDTFNNFSDEGSEKDMNRIHEELDGSQPNCWHTDNEVNSKSFPPRVTKYGLGHNSSGNELEVNFKTDPSGPPANFTVCSGPEDPTGMPPEWSPPNLSVPVLNLVDKVFQLKRRGWLRRQVFWISKQILQLVMEDAIDDWLLGQINWLRQEDVIAQGIHWLQDVLWPGGTFFIKIGTMQTTVNDFGDEQKPFQMLNQFGSVKPPVPVSFEEQLEAARRASDLKKLLFVGAPTTLVSLIGAKQYRRCARDIYYFSQSTVCMKQLAYALLELILISVFPELRNLVWDVHEKKHVHQPV